jgi:hypothetical protein
MPFNYPWSPNQPPFTAGIMTLIHEECVYVKTKCDEIITKYQPVNPWESTTPTDDYVISTYNGIDGWKKAINGETYAVIKQYDPLVHTLGIDGNGIVQPVEEEPVEESIAPIEEV